MQEGDGPFVSCVMPTTAKRLWCLERSIRCWLRQTWGNRDLLIVSDGDGVDEIRKAIFAVAGGDKRIAHVHVDSPATLGAKYNLSIGLAKGPYIALWADDDWHHPARLEVVMRALARINRQADLDGDGGRILLGGTNTMMAYRTRDKASFMYWIDPLRPHLVSGTAIFAKELWKRIPFPELKQASDTAWMYRVLMPEEGRPGEERVIINDPRLYVAFVHGTDYDIDGGNRGNQLDRGRESAGVWERMEDFDMRRIITEDRELFGLEA